MKRLAIAMLAFGLLCAAPAGSQSLVNADKILVVPFWQPPMEKSDHLDVATNAVGKNLTSKKIDFVVGDPVSHLSVAANAKALCAQYGATSILVGSLRTEQTIRVIYAVYVSIVHYPTHAEVRLAQMQCDGTILWSTVSTADTDHIGNNVGAAVSGSAEGAVGKAIEAFVARTPSAPSTPAPLTAPSPQPNALAAIVPFTQPGSTDPSLDFATTRLAEDLKAHGVTTVTLAPIEQLSVISRAGEICTTFGVKSIYLGTVRTEQSEDVKTHADVLIQNIDCNGTVVSAQDAVGDHLRHGTNARAAVSSAIDDALTHWATAAFPR
jgi:hypothetical protein